MVELLRCALFYQAVEGGMSDKETYDYLKETYLASDEKIDLSIGIAGA